MPTWPTSDATATSRRRKSRQPQPCRTSSRAVLLHELVTNQMRHAPRRLVGDAKLAFQLLRGDTASGAGHQVHAVEPEVKRGRGLVEDRPGGRVEVEAASDAIPSLTAGVEGVALERALNLALRAVGVLAIRRVALAPKRLKASRIVRKVAVELHEREARLRRIAADGIVSVYRGHFRVPPTRIIPHLTYTVNTQLPQTLALARDRPELRQSPHARAICRLSERGAGHKVENSQGIVGRQIVVAVDISECRAGRARRDARQRAERRQYVMDIDVTIAVGVAPVLRRATGWGGWRRMTCRSRCRRGSR